LVTPRPQRHAKSANFQPRWRSYNEETLRAISGPVEHAFFEDVKLRVEDFPTVLITNRCLRSQRAPSHPPHSLRQYPFRFGIDILDRFKERKSATVESQFDPTRIKKAEVVLKELLGEQAPICQSHAAVRGIAAATRSPGFQSGKGPKVKLQNQI